MCKYMCGNNMDLDGAGKRHFLKKIMAIKFNKQFRGAPTESAKLAQESQQLKASKTEIMLVRLSWLRPQAARIATDLKFPGSSGTSIATLDAGC